MTKKLKLTKATIQGLPLPKAGKRDTYLDSVQSGLQLRVTSTGVKTFSVYRRMKGGSPERVTLGRFPDISVDKARDDAKQVIAKQTLGESGNLVARKSRQQVTFGSVFRDFLEKRQNRRGAYLAEATKRSYEAIYRSHLSKYEKKKLEEIKDTELGALHSRVGRDHPTQANRVTALVSSVFSYALDHKLFKGSNPGAGIRKFPETSRDRFIQSDELPRFFRALAVEPNITMRDYFLTCLLTGARRSNVMAMRWADVRLDRGEWRLRITKNGTPQTVTLSPEMISILEARKPILKKAKDAPEFVFPGPGKSGHLEEPKKGWKRILDRAEALGIIDRLQAAGYGKEVDDLELEPPSKALLILRALASRLRVDVESMQLEDLRIHDLRRTLGSWQAKTGASLAIIGKSLNHKSTSTTAIYARLDLDPVRESVNNATSAMLAAAGLAPGGEVVKLRKKK